MLEAIELSVERGGRTLFSALSFSLAPGNLLWVRGANGAGKTTLLRVLCGLAEPELGEVRWNGVTVSDRSVDPRAFAYLGHMNGLKHELTVEENLRYCFVDGLDSQRRAARVSEAMRAMQLAPFAGVLVGRLSQGLKRRAALARVALCVERAVWVLDEPFDALDEVSLKFAVRLIEGALAGGKIVVLTSHQATAIAAPRQMDLDLDRANAIGSTAC